MWQITRRDNGPARGASHVLFRDRVEAMIMLCNIIPEPELKFWQITKYSLKK